MALTKLHRFMKMAQVIRLQAATLRFLMCQTRGGILSASATNARVGKAMDATDRLSGVIAIVEYADVDENKVADARSGSWGRIPD